MLSEPDLKGHQPPFLVPLLGKHRVSSHCVRVFVGVSILSSISVFVLVLILISSRVTENPQNIIMAQNLGDFAAPNENFMCAPIALPDVAAKHFKIKPHHDG